MRIYDSATHQIRKVLPIERAGIAWGLVGVTAFSFTVPLTRFAILNDGMSALFAGTARTVIAASMAILALSLTGQRLPSREESLSVCVVALGAVIGFPLLTSFASLSTPASHSAVVIAILPATTAVISAIRTRHYPPALFWVATTLGAMSAIVFSFLHSGGNLALQYGDLLLLAAVILCALGYAEGGVVSKSLGAWQTISWGLIFATPIMFPLAIYATCNSTFQATPSQWTAFAYLSVVSMFLGFFAWYRGLAIGPMPQVSQVQLIQPVLSILWATIFLSEALTFDTALGAIIVISFSIIAIQVKNKPAK